MDSRRELLIQAIVAALNAPQKPPGLAVNRNRRTPTEVKDLPHTSVYLGSVLPGLDERLRALTKEAADRELFITVRTIVAADEQADAAMDPYSQWVTQALATVTKVGEKGVEIEEQGSVWLFEQASDFDYLSLETVFRARYVTRRADLTQ